jgi:hypothetical protein
MFLEFFGPDHGHEEVDEEQQRDDRDDNCFHGVLLEPVAKAHVKSADDEKQDDGANEEEVVHCLRRDGGFPRTGGEASLPSRMRASPMNIAAIRKAENAAE